MYLLAMRFSREPAVRKKLRQIYRQNLLLSIYPTKKGRNEIDESHVIFVLFLLQIFCFSGFMVVIISKTSRLTN